MRAIIKLSRTHSVEGLSGSQNTNLANLGQSAEIEMQAITRNATNMPHALQNNHACSAQGGRESWLEQRIVGGINHA